MAVNDIEMEQTITLEEATRKAARRLSTKEAAMRMLRDLSAFESEGS